MINAEYGTVPPSRWRLRVRLAARLVTTVVWLFLPPWGFPVLMGQRVRIAAGLLWISVQLCLIPWAGRARSR
jgi:hypothetical protein